jgi:hypothetical protein
MKPTQTKPSIVFCRGIWADGSCFNKLIPTLQAEGYEVLAANYGLDSQAADVTATKRTLGWVNSQMSESPDSLNANQIARAQAGVT